MTKTAVILGSGIWRMLQGASAPQLSEGRTRETPFGPSRPVYEAVLPGGRQVFLLTRHGERGYRLGAWAVNYRANLWALKDLGADHILATCACGGIDPGLAVGSFVVPHDILDKTTCRAKTCFESSGLGIIRHADPFCPALRSALVAGLEAAGDPHRTEGIYVCTDGPRLETPAEIRSYARDGATIIGMTLAPEFALARELEMCYAALAFVVNPAEGVGLRPYRPDVLFEGMATDEELEAGDRAADRLPEILAKALERVAARRPCHCREAMKRYKDRGEIGEDFRTWLKS
jgi:5'-methylthioadenosine phosphorylase